MGRRMKKYGVSRQGRQGNFVHIIALGLRLSRLQTLANSSRAVRVFAIDTIVGAG